MTDTTIGDYLQALGSKTPTPGGGSVASLVGALACALGNMVLAYSVNKQSLAEHKDQLQQAIVSLTNTQQLLLELAREDEAAYAQLNALEKLDKDDPKRAEIPAAALQAAQVPLSALATCVNTLRLLDTLSAITNVYLHSDLAIAAILAHAGAKAAGWNVRVNLPSLSDETQRASMATHMEQLLGDARLLCAGIEEACTH